jgi:hypothetical protein
MTRMKDHLFRKPFHVLYVLQSPNLWSIEHLEPKPQSKSFQRSNGIVEVCA